MSKNKSGAVTFSATRRQFISTLLRSGASLAAAVTLSESAFAGSDSTRPAHRTYDYIIVGAGSAGCVLAERFSAAGFRTLLIEAGTRNITQPKLAKADLWLDNIGTETDWQIPVVPQRGLANRSLTAIAGRALGGTGSINGMFWLRPDTRDFAVFGRLLGPKWSVDNLYARAARLERFVTGNSPRRSLDGHITVGRYSPANPFSDATIRAAGEISIQPVDHNASRFINGIGYADSNIEPNGNRSGPAQTYIADAITRDNLDLVTDTLVAKLMIDAGTCRGIECVVNGTIERFYANNEVVLSAGAFGSPKLLMLSGVGRATELRRCGIEVAHHLPAVGDHLQDHMILGGIAYRGGPAYVAGDVTLGKAATHAFTSTGDPSAAPNIQITCMQAPFPPDLIADGNGFSLIPWLGKVKSRGCLTLRSADPRVSITADPGYLTDDRDIEVLLRSLDLTLAIGSSVALRPYVSRPFFDPAAFSSRSSKVQFIRENAGSGLHFVSTCRPGTDPAVSVVDPKLCVWGIGNLRVVDGSVLPEVPGVNPHLTILTVAELAADIILNLC